MPFSFSRLGLGIPFANTFNRAVAIAPGKFPNVTRGQTLLMIADFGGNHRGPYFDTYSFLILDLDRNSGWFQDQAKFRRSIMRVHRRMAFKSLNDLNRRRALIPFLQAANNVEGFLATFAISKTRSSIFEVENHPSDDEGASLSATWKPAVFERAMRVIHLSAFLLSGLSAPNQNLLWVIDEDEIASNAMQLTQLTKLFGRIWSNYDAHDLGHIQCGTTKSDDGSLALEDLAAVPDLVAGAVGEVGTDMLQNARFPARGIFVPLSPVLSWKTRTILNWLSHEVCPLQRLTCFVELNAKTPGMRVSQVRWEVMQNAHQPFKLII